MKKMTRRDLCAALPAAAALVAGSTHGLRAQTHTSEFPAPQGAQAVSPGGQAVSPGAQAVNPGGQAASPAVAGAGSAAGATPGGGTMGAARAIAYDQMPVRAMANGGEGRSIAHGTVATGEAVSLRQSMQPAGATPLGLHAIQHTEFILVREGELEFEHEVEGEVVTERVGPGGALYVAFGTKHAIKNVGTVAARYFVVAVGGDTR